MRTLLIILALALAPVVFAQTALNTAKAQIEMLNRVLAAAELRAQQLGLNGEVVEYCQVELHHNEDQFPHNGEIPFGVDYNQVTDPVQLENILKVRESYEKTFMYLCLARVKRELSTKK